MTIRAAYFWLATVVLIVAGGSCLAGEPSEGVVSFSVEASREVEAGKMEVRMFAENSGPRAEDVHQALAARLDAALKLLRSAGIKTQTSGYNSRPLREPGQAAIRGWLGRYDLSWETDDVNRGNEILSTLLAHMDVAGVAFTVSDVVRGEVTQALISEALALFQQRGQLIASALGRKGFRLGELSINEQGGPPIVPMRAAMVMAEAGPPMEPGTTRIVVGVSGSIVLDPPAQ